MPGDKQSPRRPVVMCFGDSNTNGICPMADMDDHRRFNEYERWPGIMRDAFVGSVSVIEEGLPGRTTMYDDDLQGPLMNGKAAVGALLLTHFPVDVVVIMLGTNDLKSRFSLSALEISLSVERLVQDVIGSTLGPNCDPPQVLLVAPPQLLEGGWSSDIFAGGQEKAKKFPGLFLAVAEKAEIQYIDAGSLVSPDPMDNIHLSLESHKTLGLAIAEKVNGMLKL